MSDTESSLSVGGLGVGGDTSASSADEGHDHSDAGASEGDDGIATGPSKPSMFESSFLKGLSNLRLRKLARAHGIATNLQPRGLDL